MTAAGSETNGPSGAAIAAAIAAARLGPVAAMGGRTLRSHDVAAAAVAGARPCRLNGAVLLRPPGSIDLDEAAATLHRFFADTTAGEVTLSSPWPLETGFAAGWAPAVGRRLWSPPPKAVGGAVAEPFAGVHVDEADDSAGLATWLDAHERLEPDDAGRGWLDERALADGCLRLFLGRAGGRLVAVAPCHLDRAGGLVIVDVVTDRSSAASAVVALDIARIAGSGAGPCRPTVLVTREGGPSPAAPVGTGRLERWRRTYGRVDRRVPGSGS